MYSKFENFMKKYLAPLADKMDKEVHLSAVKKSNGCNDAIVNYR